MTHVSTGRFVLLVLRPTAVIVSYGEGHVVNRLRKGDKCGPLRTLVFSEYRTQVCFRAPYGGGDSWTLHTEDVKFFTKP